MRHRISRIDDLKPSNLNYRRSVGYDWNKLLAPEVLRRHKWLAQTWINLYIQNPDDEFVRKLSTDELLKSKWYEKYGIKEPSFVHFK